MKNNLLHTKHWVFALLLATSCASAGLPVKTIHADTALEIVAQTAQNQNTADGTDTSTKDNKPTSDSSTEENEATSDSSTEENEVTAETTEEKTLVVYSTADDLNLRKKASIYSDSLKKIDAGESMTVLSEKGNWYKVQSGKKTGYVNKLYVSEKRIAFSNTENLNLRKKPSTDSKVIDQFYQGDSMIVLEKKGNWYKVQYGEKTGYVKKKYIDFQCNVYIDGDKVNIRKNANTESSVIKRLNTGDVVTLLEQKGNWYKVRYKKKVGYVRDIYLSFTEPVKETVTTNNSNSNSSNSSTSGNPKVSSGSSTGSSSSNRSSSGSSGSSSGSASTGSSSLGQSIVNYAKQFLGNPYVYGGTSLTNGADCSGFVQSVYAHFGISLPRTSEAQRSAGYSVGSLANAKPGDLICYYGHVGIYIGNNAIIHASNEASGIKITYNASYRTIASIRRVI